MLGNSICANIRPISPMTMLCSVSYFRKCSQNCKMKHAKVSENPRNSP